jgi:hypothetical protein
MALGCALSYIVSPFTGLTLTVSSQLEISPGEVSLKRNGVFVIAFFAVAQVFIHLV